MKFRGLLLLSLGSFGLASTFQIPVKDTPEFRRIGPNSTYSAMFFPSALTDRDMNGAVKLSYKSGKVVLDFDDKQLARHTALFTSLIGTPCPSVKVNPPTLRALTIQMISVEDSRRTGRYTFSSILGEGDSRSMTVYYFTPTGGSVTGSCTSPTGYKTTFDVKLGKGFNAVMQTVNRKAKTASLLSGKKPIALMLDK